MIGGYYFVDKANYLGVVRHQLVINNMAVRLIESIKKPVAVLSIAGPYRSGKSYILSRLLGSHDAFEVGNTTRAQTHGIWMGTTVLECDDYVILLLDTEGLDAASSDFNDDAKRLVLTLLLSSYFIYNTRGSITNDNMQKMR